MVLISEMKIENISRTFCCLYKGLWLWDFIDQYSIIFSTLGIIKTQSEPITYKAKGSSSMPKIDFIDKKIYTFSYLYDKLCKLARTCTKVVKASKKHE